MMSTGPTYGSRGSGIHAGRGSGNARAVAPDTLRNRTARCFVLLLLGSALAVSCQQPDPLQEKKNRTLQADERYIVELYLKISEIEENLQDNPQERAKKLDDLHSGIDVERVRRTLVELRKDPERWLAIYNRIQVLLKRRETAAATGTG